MSNRRAGAIILAICVVLWSTTFGEVNRAVAQQADMGVPVVVLVAPLSGDAARAGEQLVESARLAAQQAQVGLEIVDEESGLESVAQQLEALAQRDDVVGVVGPMRGRNVLPMAQRIQTLGLPTVVYSAREGIEDRGSQIFRGRLTSQEQAAQLVAFAVDDLGLDDLAIMAPENEIGEQMALAVAERTQAQDGRLRALALYGEDTTDFGPHIEVLQGRRVAVGRGEQVGQRRADRQGTIGLDRRAQVAFDGLIIADHHSVVARIIPFLRRAEITSEESQGSSIQLLGLTGWHGDSLARVGTALEGAIFFDTYGGERDGAMAREVASEFRAALDRQPTTPEIEIFDLVHLFGQAAREAPDSGQWRSAVRDFLGGGQRYEGASGTWQFTRTGEPQRQMGRYLVGDDGSWVRDDGGRR